MGRFAERYTPAQKRACAELCCSTPPGRPPTPQDAVRMAAAGELEGLEPFEITLSCVQKEATKLRRRKAGDELRLKREKGTTEERLEALLAQRLRILEFAQDRIEARVLKDGPRPQDLADLKAIALVDREIRARAAAPATRTGRAERDKPRDRPDTTPQSSLVSEMQRDLREADPKNQSQNGDSDGGADVSEARDGGLAGVGA